MMAEDSENGQVATGQDETAPVVTEPSENAPQVAPEAGETTQDATEKGPIPYDRFKEVNDQLKAEKEARAAEAERLRQYELALMQRQTPQQPPQDPLADVQDDDYLTAGQVREAMRLREQQAQAQQAQQAKQQFMAQHQDYNSLVGSTDPITGQFQPAPALKQACTEDPGLWQRIVQSPDADLLAYQAAQNVSLRNAQNQRQEANQQQQIQNQAAAQTQPQSMGAAGGGGNTSMQSIPDRNTPEFDQLVADVKAGRFD